MNNYIMEIMLGSWDKTVRFTRRHNRTSQYTERFYTPTENSAQRLEIILANEINTGRADINFRFPLIFISPTT